MTYKTHLSWELNGIKNIKVIMAQLAIKGHADRGEEVIKMLELLGGKKDKFNTGKITNHIYFVNTYGHIESTSNSLVISNFKVLTLEELEAQIPYKIGDKVLHEDEMYEITGVRWHQYYDKICYNAIGEKNKLFLFDPDKFTPVVNNEEFQNKLLKIYPDGETGHIQLIPHKDYEIKEINGDFVMVKKQSEYPKTFKECCDVLCITNDDQYVEVDNPVFPNKLIESFTELLICRKAYWKIAGEQMRLDKPWKPDWESYKDNFCIITYKNKPIRYEIQYRNRILAFPNEEMRDAFYENFKELIEECKELL